MVKFFPEFRPSFVVYPVRKIQKQYQRGQKKYGGIGGKSPPDVPVDQMVQESGHAAARAEKARQSVKQTTYGEAAPSPLQHVESPKKQAYGAWF
jgi:hypothetical protein